MRREEICMLSHAELVELALRLDALLERAQVTITAQQVQTAQLEARVRELEGRLGEDGPQGMPGLKARQARSDRARSGPTDMGAGVASRPSRWCTRPSRARSVARD